MKSAAFHYRFANDLEDASRLLAKSQGRTKLMAGGQSFGPMLNLRLTRPEQVVDLSHIADLGKVRIVQDHIDIGAGVTHSAIEDGEHAPLRGHPMQQVAAGIAYRAVRNRGTLGGSLAHADPAADWIVTLLALDAQLTLISPRGSRAVPMEGFMQAAYTTVLEVDEVIASVRVPKAAGGRWGYYKFCRKPGEFAEASAAVFIGAARGVARVALGALDGAPLLLPELARNLSAQANATVTSAGVADAVAAALPERDVIDRKLLVTCLTRALAQAGVQIDVLVGDKA